MAKTALLQTPALLVRQGLVGGASRWDEVEGVVVREVVAAANSSVRCWFLMRKSHALGYYLSHSTCQIEIERKLFAAAAGSISLIMLRKEGQTV